MHACASLDALGWTPAFEHLMKTSAPGDSLPARVIAQHRGGYVVAGEECERTAELTGRLLRDSAGELPAVGDWVAVRPLDDERALIVALLPRRTAFSRDAAGLATREQVVAANVDVSFLVMSAVEVNPRRLERYLALAWEGGTEPVVVLTKRDLAPDLPGAVLAAEAVAIGVPVIAVSNVTGEGIDEVRRFLDGNRTAALLGVSGAGKSSLANRLLERALQPVAEVRSDGRGRHTTTRRELLPLPGGGLVLDTPGMRELALWEASEGVRATFADIEELAAECRFGDCRHEGEPGCAVRAAIESGRLEPERLASYRKLERELAALERRRNPVAAAAHRARWRAINKEARKRARRR